ncbi:MAG: hypothetical protein EA368_12195 [Leptolyngbya sp. DLM2.Bin27]|nr:MAG: hypothetical protein EA368_12195 [Leptolyngbya sp. DLM2.Bin27]
MIALAIGVRGSEDTPMRSPAPWAKVKKLHSVLGPEALALGSTLIGQVQLRFSRFPQAELQFWTWLRFRSALIHNVDPYL